MAGWKDEWTVDGWLDGKMNGRLDGRMAGWNNELIDLIKDGCIEKQ